MARRTRSSRLTRYAENQSKKQFLLFGVGTIIIIFLLIQFAGPILGIFGDIVFGIRGEENHNAESSQLNEVLFPPILNTLPSATPSAQIDISGTSNYEEGNVILYINNRESDSAKLGSDKKFIFRKVDLKNGENIIKVYYVNGEKKSSFSQEYTVRRSSEKPELEITSPSNGSTFKRADKRINISGRTNANNTVTVNGFRAVVDSKGEFSYLLELNEGDNKISIESTNEAGIKESKEITVKYENG